MDINNFKRWVNSGHADSFSLMYTDLRGIRWFIYGSKLPYEEYYDCNISLAREVSPSFGFRASGLTIETAIADCMTVIGQKGSILTEKMLPDAVPAAKFSFSRKRTAYYGKRYKEGRK